MAEKRVENGCYFFTFRILCPPCWNVFLWERQSVFQRFVVRIQVSDLATCCFLSQDFSLQVLLRIQGLGWFKLIKSGQHPRPPFIKSKFGQMFSMFNFLFPTVLVSLAENGCLIEFLSISASNLPIISHHMGHIINESQTSLVSSSIKTLWCASRQNKAMVNWNQRFDRFCWLH